MGKPQAASGGVGDPIELAGWSGSADGRLRATLPSQHRTERRPAAACDCQGTRARFDVMKKRYGRFRCRTAWDRQPGSLSSRFEATLYPSAQKGPFGTGRLPPHTYHETGR